VSRAIAIDNVSVTLKDKEILAFCKVSMRGYEAQRILGGAGFTKVRFMEGGVAGWPFGLDAGKK